MLIIVVFLVLLAIVFLPLRHAFGINLVASFLFIVPEEIGDVTSYFFIIIFMRLVYRNIFLKKNYIIDPFVKLFIYLFLIAIISFLVFEGIAGVEFLRRYFMTILILFTFVNIYNSFDDLILFVKYFLVGTVLLSLHLYTQTLFIVNPFAQAEFSSREGRLLPRGFANQYVNPNAIGALLVWGFGLVTGFYKLFYLKYLRQGKRMHSKKVSYWIVIFFINTIVLVSMLGSRTNFIVFVLSTIVIIFSLSLSNRSIKLFFISIFIFSLSSLFILSILNRVDKLPSDNILSPLVNRFITSEDEFEGNVDYARSNLSQNGFNMFLKNPIFGIGIGNESNEMKENYGMHLVSHNTFISLLSEIGVFGLFFIISILFIWYPIVKFSFAFNIFIMVFIFAYFHSILLMSLPWLMMSFTKKSYDLLIIRKELKS